MQGLLYVPFFTCWCHSYTRVSHRVLALPFYFCLALIVAILLKACCTDFKPTLGKICIVVMLYFMWAASMRISNLNLKSWNFIHLQADYQMWKNLNGILQSTKDNRLAAIKAEGNDRLQALAARVAAIKQDAFSRWF